MKKITLIFLVSIELTQVKEGGIQIIKIGSKNKLQSVETNIFRKEFPFFLREKNEDGFLYVGLIPVKLGTKEGIVEGKINIVENKITKFGYFNFLVKSIPARWISINVPSLTKKSLRQLGVENKKLAKVYKKITPEKYWDGKFILPCKGKITSGFGIGRKYNKGLAKWRHKGIDFSGKNHKEVFSANSGVVILTKKFKSHGDTIVIDHGQGLQTIYLHLSKILVKVKQKVKKGEKIGEIGSTGLSTAPHLHWGAKLHNVTINPLTLVETELP